ncbi:PQQ-binding-like beta-propeller repeat protein [Tuwongella immobilis]|uniref:Pyrrolo-quinoline quinone repeat domain-containing protein n=1 Tax=Tuwongella immobilis TaxID=692036 RepID=A0A6C2YTW0_9BACT|nr:PQQ-binding-like beta-propeller repeat protein [Tuwongella immobilis]VIP04469.1 Uncharacterized protein OS=Blastopirellula marina DSM 3645 GN=DSM3645_23226 PE=4 SV=1: PQQ_2 [Tuwongella immobilis]VTS06300.1 Uncharacterized protein OS=Blastopirellula marina DSM 3645 GN=DSM3645_23226 PE=4 SV=1: PQQ_2 [Tuwongella immobilis]
MRRLLMILCVVGVVGCSRSVAEEPAPVNTTERDLRTRKTGVDWPRFLGPTQDGVSPEKGILTTWPATGLKIIWEAPLGEGYAAPTTSLGRLYHFDRVDNSQVLTCRNAETGKRLWEFRYPTTYEDFYGYSNGPRCCPVVDEDRVYIYGPEGMLVCLHAVTGERIWQLDTAKKYNIHQNFFGVGSTPVVEGDLLLVAVGGSPAGERRPDDFRDAKPNQQAIVALDKKTGEVRYTIGNDLASYATPVLTNIGNQRVGLYFARGGLYGFDPKAGTDLFQFPWRARILESVNASNPIVVKDQILITECYGPGSALLKFDGKKVESIWDDSDQGRDKRMQCHWNTPIHVDGYVYGSSGRHTSNAELRCIKLADGELQWKKSGHGRSSLLQIDGHLISQSEEGVLRLLRINPEKYEERAIWECEKLSYPCWAAPVVSHGILYVRGKDRLLAVELIPAK